MPVPTTSVGLSSIQAEYGGGGSISLSEYYRGDANGNVPSGQTSGFGTIPTSGEISIGVFRGTTRAVAASVNIANTGESGTDTNFDNANASAGYILYNNGSAETYNISNTFRFTSPLTGQWLVAGSASDFSVRATITSLTGSGVGYTLGTFNTWLSLSQTREWSVNVAAAGNDVQEFIDLYMTIDIALTSNLSNILDTASIELHAMATTL